MSRRKLPDDQIRVQIWCRLKPTTLAFLKKMGEKNIGRAVDRLVDGVERWRALRRKQDA